jgi:hypothetical protein
MSKLGDLNISPKSQKRFEKLIGEMQKTTGRDMQSVVRFAAKDTAFQLIKVTPIGKGRTKGFAKAGWGVALSGLGVRPSSFIFRNTSARPALWPAFGSIKDNSKRTTSPEVEMTNSVPCIEEMNGSSAVIPMAFHNAGRIYEKRLTKIGRKMAKQWAR